MDSVSEIDYHDTGETFDAGKHGKDYEIEMSKFLLKRIMYMNFKNFKFTREKKGLGKFDDLIFVVEEQDKRWYSLVQLKHILNDTKKISYESLAVDVNSYFHLPKYFVYYLDSLSSDEEDTYIRNAELENLIMCTNVGFDDCLWEIEKILVHNNGIFKNSGNLYKLCMPKNAKRRIFSKSYVPDIVKLAQELCMNIMLNNNIDYNTLIKHEHASLIKKYYFALCSDVFDCNKNAFKHEFLISNIDPSSPIAVFRKCLIDSINDLYLKYNTLENDLKRELGLSIKKTEQFKSLLQKFCPSNPLEFLKNVRLNIKKGLQEISFNSNSHNSLPVLIDVNEDVIDEQIDKFLSKLLFAVEQKNNEALLRQEMSTDMFISFNDRMNEWYHCGSIKSDTKLFRQREWLTKEKLFSQAMKTYINFQNRKICLDKILDDQTLLDSGLLMQVFCKRNIDIGNSVEKRGEGSMYYIPRFLTRIKYIQKRFLKETNADIVILTDNKRNLCANDVIEFIQEDETLFSLENINERSRFIFVSQSISFREHDFDEVVKQFKTKFAWENVHWLEIHDNYLLWRKTNGTLGVLQKYFIDEAMEEDSISESELANSRGVIIIVGEPGMGKSTLLQHIAECKLAESTPMWIIKVIIKDVLDKLDSSKSFKNMDDVINFLDQEVFEDSFNKIFLKYCLSNRKAILMFDGYDEVQTNVQEKKLLNIIKFFKANCDIEQIWITTRPHKKDELESTLGVVSVSIKELTQEQQVWFLSEFWVQATNKNLDHIREFSNRLVESLNKGLIKGNSFLGIPLQTYMFAIVFMQEVIKDKPEINNNLELTNLFQRFMHTKYDLYFKKFGPIFLPEDIKYLLMKLLDKIHQDFAFRNINLPFAEEFRCKQISLGEDRLLEIGIVYRSNEKFQFIHRAFAEYLTAKKLADIVLNKEMDDPLRLDETLEILISNHESKFLLFLFDSELVEKFPLHKSVFRGLLNEVEKFSNDEMDTNDCLNRSLYYYAVQYRHFNILEMLIRKKGYLSENDEFLVLAVKAYLNNCYKYDKKKLQSTDEFFSSLFDSSFNFSLKIINEFDLCIEMERKNWEFVKKVLKARQVTKIFGNNLYFLENALKYESPMDIILLLFESIRINNDSFEIYSFVYSNFIKYLFKCDIEFVDRLYRRYKGSFENRFPLFVDVYEYFDLRHLYLGDSLSSLISIVEKRASHFALITKQLLENGASYLLLKYNNVDDVFSDQRINLRFMKDPLVQHIEENLKIDSKYLNLTLENFIKQNNLSQTVDECKEVITNFKNIIKLNLQDTVKDVMINIVTHILKNTDAALLLHLFYNFHQAVETNDYKFVKQCLKEANRNSWNKALLNSTNANCRTAKEEAKRKYHLRIYVLLRKMKL